MKKTVTLCLTLLACMEGPSYAADVSPDVVDALSKLKQGEKLAVIVRFVNHADYGTVVPDSIRERRRKIVDALKTKTRESLRTVSPLLAEKKAVHKDLWIINGISLKVDAAMVASLRAEPMVAGITLDAEVQGPVVSFGSPAQAEWNLSMVQATDLWNMGLYGDNVVVASMDTGVDMNHPDLKDSWRGGTNSWYDPYAEHATPHDANGHGTMVMGIINGGGNGGTSIGMAPNAKWIGVKIFKDNGYASLSAIHQGFQWLLDPDGDPATDDAPHVVNSSWGLGNINGCSTEFTSDLQVLNDAGITAVFASGNYGPNQYTSISPSNDPVSVPVGALDYTGSIAGFSSRGPSACDGSIYPLIAAPGADIRTADLTYGGAIPQSYSIVSGTSFAAAHVSGALALLSGAFPSAGRDELVSALLTSAQDLDVTGADNAYGAGLLQAKAAYDILAQSSPVPQPEPVIDLDKDGYSAGDECNDNDASIHPGATEVKRDGIDQDCNGYDLTINITRATYSDAYKSFRVEATSSLGADAALEAVGLGPMNWSANLNKWVLTVRTPEMPADVTVSGIEGSEVLVLKPAEPQPQPAPEPLPEPLPEPTPSSDMDGDGYLSGEDCNDNDPSIHPGATEIKRDGVDQDCNGYDLTINVTRATYSDAYKSLRIEATSSLGADAGLSVSGFGPMSWSPNLKKWVLTVRTADRPADVTVSGVEGLSSAPVN